MGFPLERERERERFLEHAIFIYRADSAIYAHLSFFRHKISQPCYRPFDPRAKIAAPPQTRTCPLGKRAGKVDLATVLDAAASMDSELAQRALKRARQLRLFFGDHFSRVSPPLYTIPPAPRGILCAVPVLIGLL